MGVSLFSFTTTVKVGFRTFIIGIQSSFLVIVRHVNGLLRCWGRLVGDVANRARHPVFAWFGCSHLGSESIITMGIDDASLVFSYEELYVPLVQEVQNLIGGE